MCETFYTSRYEMRTFIGGDLTRYETSNSYICYPFLITKANFMSKQITLAFTATFQLIPFQRYTDTGYSQTSFYLTNAGPRSSVGSSSDSRARGPGFDTRSGHILPFLLPLIQEGWLSVTGESMCTKVVNRLGGLSLPRKKKCAYVNDRPVMIIDVYRGR